MNCSFSVEESSCSENGAGSAIRRPLGVQTRYDLAPFSLGIRGKRGRGEAEVSESELIINRAGHTGILREEEKEAPTICPKHKKKTVNYRLAWP